MSDALSIAVSGLVAQGKRLSASASNIANATTSGRIPTADNPSSTVYKPLEVKLSSTATDGVAGAVKAEYVQSDSYIPSYSPSSIYADSEGMIATPDVDLATESVNMLTAKIAYKAGVATIKAQDEMMGDLLDAIK